MKERLQEDLFHMKKSNILEIIGILSLSLVLLSGFAVSSCLPDMLHLFPDHDRASVEFLISSPSMSMVFMIALTPFLSKCLNERVIVTLGLLLCGVCGIIPFFIHSFSVISVSRILLGVGIGLLNAKAVSLIGERFTGTLRLKLQGIRCSMETIGQAVMFFAVGQLLRFGWNYVFLIYGIAFVILLMYYAFVPATPKQVVSAEDSCKASNSAVKIGQKEGFIIFLNFLLGMILVSSAVLMSLRLTSYVVESGLGTAVDGANILSLSVFSGFVGGLIFGRLMQKLGRLVLPLALLFMAGGMTAISLGSSLAVVGLGTCVCNFFITIGTSYMFNGLSEHLPVDLLNTANSIVLVGCNLGSCTISFVLQAIGLINPSLSFAYFCYAIMLLMLSAGFFGKFLKSASGKH